MRVHSVNDLCAAVRGRRRSIKLSQAKVAEAAGVSRVWLSEFESGKSTVEVGKVLAVLDVLDLAVELQGPGETRRQAFDRRRDQPMDLDMLIQDYDEGER